MQGKGAEKNKEDDARDHERGLQRKESERE